MKAKNARALGGTDGSKMMKVACVVLCFYSHLSSVPLSLASGAFIFRITGKCTCQIASVVVTQLTYPRRLELLSPGAVLHRTSSAYLAASLLEMKSDFP